MIRALRLSGDNLIGVTFRKIFDEVILITLINVFIEFPQRFLRSDIYAISIQDFSVASPVIIGPVTMLGFLDSGGTNEGQAIYRSANNTDFTRG